MPARDENLPTFPPAPVDPESRPPITRWPRQRDRLSFYGGVGLHQIFIPLPFPMQLAWDKGIIVKRMQLHEKVAKSAGRAFERIADAYDEEARKKLGLDMFGGSLNVRKIRGGSSYSMHSWGIATDFDPEWNQLNRGGTRPASRSRTPRPSGRSEKARAGSRSAGSGTWTGCTSRPRGSEP